MIDTRTLPPEVAELYRHGIALRQARLAGGDDTAVLGAAHQAFLAALAGPGLPRPLLGEARNAFLRMGSYGIAARLGPDVAVTELLSEMPRVRTREDRLALLQRHREWGDQLQRAADADPIERTARHPQPRLRLGLLSADLRAHLVGAFAGPLLNYPDERFEVFCYATDSGPDDPIRTAIASLCTYRRCGGETPRAVAQRIYDDGIDILLDLGGQTGASPAAVLAYKPAPVIVSWMAYPHSTGLDRIDYLIVDPFNRPPPDLMIERPLELPRSWVCYFRAMMPNTDDRDTPIPEDANGYVTFGTANNPYKYSPEVLALWGQVMAGTPGSRFVFVRPEAASPVFRRNMIAGLGVEPERVVFAPVYGDHLGSYDNIDISLDPFPLTGGTSTLDALWMGVPVVSLVGEAMYERLSYSILQNVGLGDLARFSPDEYARTAIELAQSPGRRRALKGSLRSRMRAGPLGDPRAFAADFYEALKGTRAALTDMRPR